MRIALDLSCLVPQPLTGVGYYTINLFEAYHRLYPETAFRVVSASAQAASAPLREAAAPLGGVRHLRLPTRLKTLVCSRLEWPPVEWITGAVDIVHGGFHLLPPSRRAPRMITLFDLTNIRQRDTHSDDSIRIHEQLLRHAVSQASALVAISESTRQDAIELLGADPDKVHVVYGGVVLDEFDRPFDEPLHRETCARFGLDGPYWIHLGTLEPRKNLVRLVEAYARVRSSHPDCPKLVLAGGKGWMYEGIFEAIGRLRLGEAVVHTDYLKREEAVSLLRGADACVYPSLYEGFGLPVLEAMAARVPVLTSNVSSLPEVIGDTGIQVDPESEDAIAAGLLSLLHDRDGAEARIPEARTRAETFTWDHSARALHAVYEGLMP